MRRILIVLAALVVVAGAFTAGALIFRDGGDEGWSEADEKTFMDEVIDPGPLNPRTEAAERFAACVLDVYEQYFPSYDDWADASENSPTFLKADVAAERKCKVR
jgi:hypothetical protein